MEKKILFLALTLLLLFSPVVVLAVKSTNAITYQGDTIENYESGKLKNWLRSTGNLHAQPVKAIRGGLRFNQQGDYFIGTAETGGKLLKDYNDSLTGELKSKPFVVKKHYLNFLIGGGNDYDNLYIALIRVSDGYIIHKATGNDSEWMSRQYWEVSDYLGILCYLKIVDNAKGAWGHINIDDIQMSDNQPPEKYIPLVIAGEFKRIYNPSIGEKENWYINDHCFIYGKDKLWHLFGITHQEPANPIDEDNFAHAVSSSLSQFPWKKEPFALSVVEDPWKEVHLWAPYVLYANDTYYMFYCAGDKDPTKYKIHLATSPDLWSWTRHPENPVVVDGYHARDPFVLRVDNKWVIYYTATSEPQRENHVVAYRTSDDLVHWSDRKIAYTDPSIGKGGGPTESPFIVHRGEYYYLFIGPRGGYVGTDIFRSKSPFEFKIEDQVGHIASHAAEVIRDLDGTWYVSHCGWGEGGVYLAPLYWND